MESHFPSGRYRNFVWTLNNPSAEEVATLLELSEVYADHGIRSFGFQSEVGSSGTPHLQGYLCLAHPLKLSFKLVGTRFGLDRAHLEVMKGSLEDSVAYCSKPDSFDSDVAVFAYVGAESSVQGNRSDLDAVMSSIRDDSVYDIDELILLHGAVIVARYHRFIAEAASRYRLSAYHFVLPGPLRSWQADLNSLLLLAPHPRALGVGGPFTLW